MTEIMPVPRNSHITVLRPPSIRPGSFLLRKKSGSGTLDAVPGAGKGKPDLRAVCRTRLRDRAVLFAAVAGFGYDFYNLHSFISQNSAVIVEILRIPVQVLESTGKAI